MSDLTFDDHLTRKVREDFAFLNAHPDIVSGFILEVTIAPDGELTATHKFKMADDNPKPFVTQRPCR